MRLATRGSPLARWQAADVASRLRLADPGAEVELVVVETTGDRRTDRPIWEIGGQGVFVKEVQAAVLDGRAEAAVHSAKDLPSRTAPGLILAAVPDRADPRDALVGRHLDDLGPGAPVATGSVRRRAQLAWLRPDLTFPGLRGNIATRLERIPPGGAIVMAAAAIERLGLGADVIELLDPVTLLPQVAQGALAVECRSDDQETLERLVAIDQTAAHTAVDAERSFLARLGGGCDLPVAAHARVSEGEVRIEGLLASLDGRVVLRSSMTGSPSSVGVDLAEHLLEAGGRGLLSDAGMGLP